MVWIIQYFVLWPILIVVFAPLYKFSFFGRENIRGLEGPLLIISNHKTIADSFVFRLALGFRTKLLPLRFMGDRVFKKRWMNIVLSKTGIIDLLYWICGVFSVTRGQEIEKVLEVPKKILDKKGIVVMYPEAFMIEGDEIGEFKKGAGVLAKMTGVKILPVAMRIKKGKLLRKNFNLVFGEPFSLTNNLSDEDNAEYLRSIVQKLYANI